MAVSQRLLHLIVITASFLHGQYTTAQKDLSYFDRLSLPSKILSQGAPYNADYSEFIENIHINLLQFSLPELQSAVLQSLQSLNDGSNDAGVLLERWTGEIAGEMEKESQQAVQNTTSELCLNHTIATVMGLLERSSWALQMLDAMGKPSPGVTQGNLNWPGAYEQCQKVRANTTVPLNPNFSGQYCTAVIPLGAQPGSSMPVQVSLGVCIPDTCSALDMTILVDSVLVSLNVSQQPSLYFTCVKPPAALDSKAIAGITICSIFLLFMIVGTFMDILYIQWPKWRMADMTYSSTNGYTNIDEHVPLLIKPEIAFKPPQIGTCMKVFLAFSVYTNGAKLLSTKQPAGSLGCVHGIRFLSMTWVVLGHSFGFPLGYSANLYPYVQEILKRWTFQAIGNASVSVDSFFVLSGLLVAYLSLKEMKKRDGKLNWFLFYFHRFWRLTPAYMLVIMVYVCFQPYWGEGPFWMDVQLDRDNCKTVWWTNLLYINNLVKTDQMCLGQSWYLANDMQFYILSPLIFVPFYFSPVLGAVSAAVFLLITSVVPGALTMRDHFPPGLLPGQLEGNVSSQADFMLDYYVKPYNRMGPYVVGMLAGYFLYRTDCKLRINKFVNLFIWAVATGCALAVLYGLYDASNGHPITLPVSAFYNAVNRQVWGACVAWVVVACVTGNGGFVNTILSWPALIPLSRLTYCIYLLHLMIISTYLLNTNTVFYADDITFVMFFLGILVVSYMAAAVTSLAFEAPMMALEKVIFGQDRREIRKEDAEQK